MTDEEGLRLTAAHRIALAHPDQPLAPAVLMLVDVVARLRAELADRRSRESLCHVGDRVVSVGRVSQPAPDGVQ